MTLHYNHIHTTIVKTVFHISNRDIFQPILINSVDFSVDKFSLQHLVLLCISFFRLVLIFTHNIKQTVNAIVADANDQMKHCFITNHEIQKQTTNNVL
jgi:hypothetical protein